MPTLYNPFRKKGVFMIPAGGLGPSVSAAFSYAKSSYHQDETDPTPTITGTTGGTFSATPSGLSINASTGTIDLSASTIQPYTITYTVDGVSANFSLSVTASPFVANTFSFNFDAASSQYIDTGATPSDFNLPATTVTESDFSISFWYYFDANEYYDPIIQATQSATNGFGIWQSGVNTASLNFWVGHYSSGSLHTTQLSPSNWYHIACVFEGGATHTQKIYVDGVENNTVSYTTSRVIHSGKNCLIGGQTFQARYFDGKLDEFAIWNAALGETAIQEIYNATNNNTGKALDLSTDYNNYTSSSNLQYWHRLGD